MVPAGDYNTIRIVSKTVGGKMMGIESCTPFGWYDSLEDALKAWTQASCNCQPELCYEIITAHQRLVGTHWTDEVGRIEPFICKENELFDFYNSCDTLAVVINLNSNTVLVEFPGATIRSKPQVKEYVNLQDVNAAIDTYHSTP